MHWQSIILIIIGLSVVGYALFFSNIPDPDKYQSGYCSTSNCSVVADDEWVKSPLQVPFFLLGALLISVSIAWMMIHYNID